MIGLGSAAAIKIDAGVKLGEFLKKAEKNVGTRMEGRKTTGRRSLGGAVKEPPSTPTLSDLGLTKRESAEAQQLAVIAREEPEQIEAIKALEIGLHALRAVPKAQGKKGEGLDAYAKQIGKTKQYVSQLREAAEVLTSVNLSSQLDKLLDKAQHLSAIHSAPPVLWAVLVEFMVAKGWNVAEAEAASNAAKEFGELPERGSNENIGAPGGSRAPGGTPCPLPPRPRFYPLDNREASTYTYV